ncbi:Uncharacterized protein PCOAH_00036730 [Plasmodium coatneyi]|uniref:Uncharacterized protein n=1 Tax=Plasmodium coatneyi TaxID=208452 RepID=A0A1B1E1W4_9APIC|nr:Uncharacterized protein PCOAH_00036730 [Plasmodium coatneyi]ANQ08839.1 Uncharacterized protein PCOAH_00036730 [Plasmodium coatneyi]
MCVVKLRLCLPIHNVIQTAPFPFELLITWKHLNHVSKFEITPKCSSHFAELSDLEMIGKHNLEDFLSNEDHSRRHRVPMLWFHDCAAAYSP